MAGVTDAMVNQMTDEEAREQRSTGSLISVVEHEGLVDLIDPARSVLHRGQGNIAPGP